MPQPQRRPPQGQQNPLPAAPQQENRSVDSSGNTGRQGPAWGAPAQPAAPAAPPQSNAVQASQQNGGQAAYQQQMKSVGGAYGQTPPSRSYYGEGSALQQQLQRPPDSWSTPVQSNARMGPSMGQLSPQQPQSWGPSTSDALSQIGKGTQVEQPGAPQMEATASGISPEGSSYLDAAPIQDAAKVPEAPQPIQIGQSSIAPGVQRQRQQQRRMQQRGYYGE